MTIIGYALCKPTKIYCFFAIGHEIRLLLAAARRRPPLRGSGHPCGVPFQPFGLHFTPPGLRLPLRGSFQPCGLHFTPPGLKSPLRDSCSALRASFHSSTVLLRPADRKNFFPHMTQPAQKPKSRISQGILAQMR